MAANQESTGRPRAGTWSMSSHTRHLHVGAGSSSSGSSDSRQRRKSGDDILHSSPSRKPALFDAFIRPRSKSDASRAKKPTTIISHMKNAVHHSLYSSSSPTSSKGPPDSSGHNHVGESANQASELRPRPRAGSESSKGPVSKVMEMFRYRSHSAVSAEDKRKALFG